MSPAGVAVAVALLLALATTPWTAGRSTRAAGVARGRPHGQPPDPRVAAGDGALGTSAAGADGAPDAGTEGPVDVVLVLDLLDVAVASGAPLPRAVQAVGDAVGGDDGAALAAVSRALVLGARWGGAWSAAPAHLAPVAECLADAWASGAAPGPRLRAAADEVIRARRRGARESAGRLGVRLVLPLGLCLLPAFVLLGLVPVTLSLAGGLLG